MGGASAEMVQARRISVMMNKYWTSTACTETVRNAIELLGGNGTIEDFSVLPRLYRDAIVIESWEGTHNALCAQILRDFSTRRLHLPWIEHMRSEIALIDHPELEEDADRARQLLIDAEDRISRLISGKELAATAHIRPVVDHLCRLTDWVALAGQLQWEKTWGVESDTGDALELYRLLNLDRADPQDTPALIELNRKLSGTI